jgi:hypothetical protein
MDSHEEDILIAPEVQCDWLRAIGFEQVEVYFKAFELAIFAGTKPNLRRTRGAVADEVGARDSQDFRGASEASEKF